MEMQERIWANYMWHLELEVSTICFIKVLVNVRLWALQVFNTWMCDQVRSKKGELRSTEGGCSECMSQEWRAHRSHGLSLCRRSTSLWVVKYCEKKFVLLSAPQQFEFSEASRLTATRLTTSTAIKRIRLTCCLKKIHDTHLKKWDYQSLYWKLEAECAITTWDDSFSARG